MQKSIKKNLVKNVGKKSRKNGPKRVKGVVKLMGGKNFGEASFNDQTFGGACYGLNTYENDLFGDTKSSTQVGGGGGGKIKSKKRTAKRRKN